MYSMRGSCGEAEVFDAWEHKYSDSRKFKLMQKLQQFLQVKRNENYVPNKWLYGGVITLFKTL